MRDGCVRVSGKEEGGGGGGGGGGVWWCVGRRRGGVVGGEGGWGEGGGGEVGREEGDLSTKRWTLEGGGVRGAIGTAQEGVTGTT